MSKKTIKREDLKTNFLKQAIIRLDYDMLFDNDIMKFTENIYSKLIDEKYKMNKNTMSNFNININVDDSNNIINNVNTNNESYTSFINEEGNISIDITKNATIMSINYESFIKFEDILKTFNEILNCLSDIRKGFSFTRIGIRKINVFRLHDISKINNYIDESTFACNYKSKDSFIQNNSLGVFKIKDYKINKKVSISAGNIIDEAGKRSIYEVVLDLDLYNDEIRDNKIYLAEMNDIIFEIYKDSMKEEFLIKLEADNFSDEEIVRI